ncbi:MAG: type II secretion system minor pseudopilin [Planctomycetota bacterium]
MTSRPSSRHRRGSVIFIVMWALALEALILSSLQLFGYRQAMQGRDTVARIQARWAARGGVEYMIAIMADHTMEPVPDDAFAMVRDMDAFFDDAFEVGGRVISSYDISHFADGKEWQGPMDEHSKLNINASLDENGLLTTLEDMSPDIADAIFDWMDDDDDERPLGAERHYYQSLSIPYEPRNGPMRNVSEIELVAGIWPEHLRGEDWNLNNRLDLNEDDGEQTWPDDDPDGVLEVGWAGLMTTYSVEGDLAASGLPRIDLSQADPEELAERLGIDEEQADALISFAGADDASVGSLLTQHIQRAEPREAPVSMSRGRIEQRAQPSAVDATGPELTTEQLRVVLAETTIGGSGDRRPGKLNLNTVSEDLLRQLLLGREHLADEIVYLRSSGLEGITSIVDLIEIPAFREDTEALEYLARISGTTSNVYSICARGRSWPSGVEVEIIAVVDRSTLPIRILEYREQ